MTVTAGGQRSTNSRNAAANRTRTIKRLVRQTTELLDEIEQLPDALVVEMARVICEEIDRRNEIANRQEANGE